MVSVFTKRVTPEVSGNKGVNFPVNAPGEPEDGDPAEQLTNMRHKINRPDFIMY